MNVKRIKIREHRHNMTQYYNAEDCEKQFAEYEKTIREMFHFTKYERDMLQLFLVYADKDKTIKEMFWDYIKDVKSEKSAKGAINRVMDKLIRKINEYIYNS